VSAKAIPKQGGFAFDERRNTSRVWPVPPDALPAALKACAAIDPALRRWIEDGHPTLTEADHVARFGAPYEATRSRKATTQPLG
jgi:hypothetical protein